MNTRLAETTICGEFHINSATITEVLTLWSASSTLHVHGTVSIYNHKQSNSSVFLNIIHNEGTNSLPVLPGNTCAFSCAGMHHIEVEIEKSLNNIASGTFGIDIYYQVLNEEEDEE
ncbi:S-Ena type endospore appendage [Paenibacillus xylanexedens]|uniref:S-Ena type endospore appendage n=1 Tax=Paenibacillus xylanexedens TaxID=528191 RepID=UPI0028E616CE|nr:S-Ena type endospore appendage [Paenibacillus xylanexedens]